MITPEEIIRIYKKHGRDAINPNIAAALAEAMTLVGARIMESVAKLAERQDMDSKTLAAAISEIYATMKVPAHARSSSSGVCYCGARPKAEKCEVCGRAQ